MSSVINVWVKRDRMVLGASVLLIITLAWLYLLNMAYGGAGMEQGMSASLSAMQAWTVRDFVLMFIMWTVMMIAMMTPSASPILFLFAKLERQQRNRHDSLWASWMFLTGYLVIWTLFSALATLAQWGLHTAALLSPMMMTTSVLLQGTLLLAAGLFQLTPLKKSCLAQCRSPLGFLIAEWRNGLWGAFVMGLKHGTFCTGCCWALMALLFVAGVMNLLWVAIIAGYVLIEKIVPRGHQLGRITGLLLIAWGSWTFVTVLF